MRQSSTFLGFIRGIGSRFLHLAMVGALFGLATAVQRAAVQWYQLPALDTATIVWLSVATLALTAVVAAYSHTSLAAPERHWLRLRRIGLAALSGAWLGIVLGAFVLTRNDWVASQDLATILVRSAASAGVLFAMFCALANAWALAQRLVAPVRKPQRLEELHMRSAV